MLSVNDTVYGLTPAANYIMIDDATKKSAYVVKKENKLYKLYNTSAEVFQLLSAPFLYHYSSLIAASLRNSYGHDLLFALYYFLSEGIAEIYDAQSRIPSLFLDKNTFIIKSKNSKWIIGNSKVCTLNYVDEQTVEHLMSNQLDKLSDSILESLYSRRYLVTANTLSEEKNSISATENYIVLTYSCNLDCCYCFEKQLRPKHVNMELSILDKILAEFSKESDPHIIVLYGGEPLIPCNEKHIQRIIDFVKTKPNFKLRIITNGINIGKYLFMFNQIRNNIHSFTITIDGNQDVHDSRRVFASGKGTYSQVINSVYEVVNHGFHCTVRINLDCTNYDNLKLLVRHLDGMQEKDLLSIYLARVEDPLNKMFEPILLQKVFDAYQTIRALTSISILSNIPVLQFIIRHNQILEGTQYFFNHRSEYCSHDAINVYDTNGQVYSCNEAMGDPFFEKDCVNSLRCTKHSALKTPAKCKLCTVFALCLGNCPRVNQCLSINHEERCEKENIESVIMNYCYLSPQIRKIEDNVLV